RGAGAGGQRALRRTVRSGRQGCVGRSPAAPRQRVQSGTTRADCGQGAANAAPHRQDGGAGMSTVIEQAIDRVDGRLKITGAARYAADFPLENMAYAVAVQSTIAKGRVRRIDTV